MNSLTGSILIDFEKMEGSEQQRNYHKQVYGAIKLQLSEMQKYEKTSHFVSCLNCKMVLTQQDRASIFDWEEISSNREAFNDVFQQCEQEQDNVVVWTCSFCEANNVVNRGELKFARNNSRVIERPAVQNAQEKKKDPILLIVFDISGSMDELLTNNDQSAFSGFVEKIKKTKIYQKIVADEQREIKQLLQKQNIKVEASDSKMKYKDYLKKNKLLMGLTEWLLNEISPSNNANEKMQRTGGFSGNVKKTKINKTIGFVFFNSNVILQPTNGSTDKKAVVVCDSKESHCENTQSMIRERANFDDFQELFKLGSDYGAEYSTKINQFQFGNLEYKFGDSSHGQTALGPAIVMALGVVSQHGAGSSIVVVTDGIGNKGIFDQSERWQQPLKLYKQQLEKYKCFLTMLQCRSINEGSRPADKNINTCIDEFCRRNEDAIARKINILMDKNRTADNLVEDIKKKMIASINRDNVIWTNQVLIKSQNANVSFQEDMGKLSQKLHNQQTASYINPKIDYSKLREKDYIHHFMTQAVIRYENTQTGEQSTFLTYILQKFIKFNSLRKQTIRKLDNERTFHDMLEYLHVEEENYDIGNVPLSFVKKSFRDTLMFSKSICNRSMRFPIGNQIENKQEDAAFIEEIYRKAVVKEEEEEEWSQRQTI